MNTHLSQALRGISVLFLAFLLLSVPVRCFGNNDTQSSLCLSGATPFLLSDVCPLGWYCPYYNASDTSTYPVQCAPTNECLINRLEAKFCDPQGKYEPTLCPKGYYCPTATQLIKCPANHFCPLGQYKPQECGMLSTCDAGAEKKFEYSSMIVIIIVDAFAVITYVLTGVYIRRRDNKRQEKHSNFKATSINPSLLAKGDAFDLLPQESKMLCQGFRRAQQQLPPMHLQFHELSLTIPGVNRNENLTILKGVTGSIEPGKVTAIMGPSGAGKTTFLNTMLGKLDPSWTKNGRVHVNGVEEQLTRFRKIIGYVPQEDVMHRDLSVYENIAYSARTRLPDDWTDEQVETHVSSVIGALGLSQVESSPVGDEITRGISGGQRKRVNIGMEIVAAPSLLLLDEPTSGLDSTAAMSICQLLTDLARVSNLTVAMVIHQPRVEIWNRLDEILLLAPGGLTVYQGPQKLCVLYFALRLDLHLKSQDNPADALLDAIAEQSKEFIECWQDSGPEYVEKLRKQYGHFTYEQISEKTLHPDFQHQVSSGSADSFSSYHHPDPLSGTNPISNPHHSKAIQILKVNDQLPQADTSSTTPAVALTKEKVDHMFDRKDKTQVIGKCGKRSPPELEVGTQNVITQDDGHCGHIQYSYEHDDAYGIVNRDEYELKTIHVIGSAARAVADSATVVKLSASAASSVCGTVETASCNATSPNTPRFDSIAISPYPSFPRGLLRRNASFLRQTALAFTRSLLKQYKNLGSLFLELTLALLAGGFMGAGGKMTYQGILKEPFVLLTPTTIEDLIPNLCFNIALGVALAAASAGVNVYGEEKAIRHREISSGHSLNAYYLGVSFAQTFRQFIDAVHFTWLYHMIGQPITTFGELLPFMFLLYMAVYNLAAIVSMLVERKNATLLGVVLSLIVCSMTAKNDVVPDFIQVFSPSRWISEGLFDRETRLYTHVMQVDSTAQRLAYTLGRFDVDVILCCLMGNLYRVVAWLLIRWIDRKVVAS